MPENETKHNENKDPLKFPKQSLSVVAVGTAEAEPHGEATYGEAAARLTLHTAVGQRDAEDVADTRWPPPNGLHPEITAPSPPPLGSAPQVAAAAHHLVMAVQVSTWHCQQGWEQQDGTEEEGVFLRGLQSASLLRSRPQEHPQPPRQTLPFPMPLPQAFCGNFPKRSLSPISFLSGHLELPPIAIPAAPAVTEAKLCSQALSLASAALQPPHQQRRAARPVQSETTQPWM